MAPTPRPADEADDSMDGVNADKVQRDQDVDGSGITIAVLDTGCRASHRALSSDNGESRVLPGRNFSGQGFEDDTTDTIGHGTAISGIIAGNRIAPVIAPGARILPLKVVAEGDENKLEAVLKGLSWLLNDGKDRGASAICLSIGDMGNYQKVADVPNSEGTVRQKIAEKIHDLRQSGIPTVVAAGNRYRCNSFHPGMAFPAIMPECLSVGAVFKDSSLRNFAFGEEYCGTEVNRSQRKQIAPFSQRLPNGGDRHFTRLFAPGAPIVSLGMETDVAEKTMLFGTSVAAPFVAGVIALLQQWHKEHKGGLPTCDDLERWLVNGGDSIQDSPDIDDNVGHTSATFKFLNALGAMNAMMGSDLMS
jgi:subtilisin family serine protease